MKKQTVRRMVTAAVALACLALPVTAAAPAGAATQAAIKVDFGPAGQKVPTGYVSDTGAAYSTSTGRGWISQTTTAPLSIVGNGRDRNRVADARLDTLIAMQYKGTSGVAKPARWEAAVQNGIYDVTVAVGDVALPSGSAHSIKVETTQVIDKFAPSATNRTATITRRVKVTDGKVTVDAAGGTNTILDYVDIVPVTNVIAAGATIARVNFSAAGTPAPYGYVNDTGAAYSDVQGYGWISQTTSAPLSIVGSGRDRNASDIADQRVDSLMCMQLSGKQARWQYALPVGTYDVTISVGDAGAIDSTHRVTIEGTVAVGHYVATPTTEFKQATVRVLVTDGFLTLDAAGGSNTKINFVDIVDADNTPRTITGVTPANGSSDVNLDAAVELAPSHAVDPATITSSTVKLLGPGGTAVAGTAAFNGTTGLLTFIPTNQLDGEAAYTVQTTTGLRDTNGNPFAAFSSGFTTGLGSDPTSTQIARINFQSQPATVPVGYSKDYGQAYDATRGFGWVQPGTQTGADLSLLGRSRNVNPNLRLDSFVHMQNAPSGDWQVSVPTGTYDVTVAVGDANGATDSNHKVSAEGTTVVGPFAPTVATRHKTGTARVKVTDGFLTLSAAGGTNTKIDYVDIDRITAGSGPADSRNPNVELSAAGPGTSPNFSGPVTVTADTTDIGSGIASIAYTVDGGASATYSGPVTVSTPGDHTVVVTATDGQGNSGSDTTSFNITAPADAPAIEVSSAEDVLGLTSRLVFSTAHKADTPAKSFTVTNTGGTDLVVSNLVIGGTSPGQFALDPSQATSFTIPADGTATVSALFKPNSLGVKMATLTVVSNDPLQGTYVVALRGVNANGTSGDTEPTISELMSTLGYSTNTGITDINQATTRAPVGDEVIAPYFKRVDTTKPVSLTPIARYVAATEYTSDTGFAPTKYSGARTTKYWFDPDTIDTDPEDGVDSTAFGENQKVMPAIAAGGTTTWVPTNPVFGVTGNFANYTDDQFNRDGDGPIHHNVRVWPAKGAGGVVIPNTWIIGVDVNLTLDKNYDYQDQVMLLTNATPELTAAAAPGTSATNLTFDAPTSSTVLDKDSQGTGFNSVQVNKNNTQYNASLIDLTGGTLRITSTAGKSSGTGAATNDQVNALQSHFDASRSDVTVETRILGPMTDLTAGFQQKALYFGPDQNNYLKLEIEHRTDTPGVFITVFLEVAGDTSMIGQVQLDGPTVASINTLDFQITGDLETGTLQAAYRINSDAAYTSLGLPFAPANIFQWFSPQARAGVLVSHTGSSTPITGVFDWFRVV